MCVIQKTFDGENIPILETKQQKIDQEIMDLVCSIIDVFEETLEEKNTTIQSNDRTGDPDEARLFGTEYYTVYDEIEAIIRTKFYQEAA
ncbi:MAG: hypothetical protein JXA98_08870 [Methanosarcinaceae archaeon]|nr:hypothetical protein [Methanosarcinaceae archaeon]